MTSPHLISGAVPAIDAVFEKILLDIVQGTYPQGSRLPAERELSRILGASRPTLREALRRLGMWNLVEPRRGSGVVVKAYRDWSVEVLPAYIRHGKPQPGQPTIARIMLDVLTLRRSVLVEVIRQTAGRIPAGASATARSAATQAWEHREDPVVYAQHDFEIIRLLVEAAAFTPGLWVLNRISTIWLDFIDAVRAFVRVPGDYVTSYLRFFDLLDSGEVGPACDALQGVLSRQDEALITAAASLDGMSGTPRMDGMDGIDEMRAAVT